MEYYGIPWVVASSPYKLIIQISHCNFLNISESISAFKQAPIFFGETHSLHPGALRPYQSKMFDWYGFYHISQLFFSYQSTFFHISQTFFHISQRNLSYQSEFRLAYQSKFRVDISQSTFDCNDLFQSDAFSYQLNRMYWYHKGPYQLKNMTDMMYYF